MSNFTAGRGIGRLALPKAPWYRHASLHYLELLEDRYTADQAAHLARVLSEGTWTHDYPITFKKAHELGLAVSCEMPQEVLQLMPLLPQPAQHRVPSMEYLPGSRHAREAPVSRWR